MAELTITEAVPSRPAAGVPAGPQRLTATAVAAVRVVVAFMFACHGAQKLFGAFGGTHVVEFGAWPAWYAGVIELFVGGLVLVGLFTRPAALLCSGSMAFAYFSVHQAAALLPVQNKGELAAIYCWIFLLIAILGPGSFALDSLRGRQR